MYKRENLIFKTFSDVLEDVIQSFGIKFDLILESEKAIIFSDDKEIIIYEKSS